jgi:uncharacterized OB-fold protein
MTICMAEQRGATGLQPIVSYLKVPSDGEPYLEGHQCSNCGAIYLGERNTCSRCGRTGELGARKLSNQGELYVYSIVYRSSPDVDVPFVSAIVDLDGGGTVKGNLVNIDPDPQKIKMGMPVETIFRTAPKMDSAGSGYLTYYFQPRRPTPSASKKHSEIRT